MLVIPIGGLGTRFSSAGITTPKPLIDIKGKPMAVRAIESFGTLDRVVVGLRRFEGYEELEKALKGLAQVVLFDEVTEGPAITIADVLTRVQAKGKEPLFTANCDQIMDWDGLEFIDWCLNSETYGAVVTFEGGEANKHSFVETKKGIPVRYTEKIKISNTALTGIHYWVDVQTYTSCVNRMKWENLRAPNGEFYVSLAYNYIHSNTRIYHIPKSWFHPVGTPQELKEYLDANP